MALIVEDGTGRADAESYSSVADATTYLTARGMEATWNALASDGAREQCLRKATDYMQQVYGSQWKGYKASDEQALDWPRTLVEIEDSPGSLYPGGHQYYENDEIPARVKNACILLALKAASADLLPDLERAKDKVQVGSIAVEYSQTSPQTKRYSAIAHLLKPLLKAVGGSVSLVRC